MQLHPVYRSAGHVEAQCLLSVEKRKMRMCRRTHTLLVGLHDLGTWPSALQLLAATERRYHIGQEKMGFDRIG